MCKLMSVVNCALSIPMDPASGFDPEGEARHGSCHLTLDDTNFLHPGKMRSIQLYISKCHLQSNKRLRTSAGASLSRGMLGALGMLGGSSQLSTQYPPCQGD